MNNKITDLDTALKAVKEKGDNIQYCTPELIANIEVLKEAVKGNYFSMQKIQNVMMPDNSGLVINNKKLMSELIKIDPRIFIYLGDNLKDDEEIVTYCVSSSRYAYLLKYAGEKVKANKNIVLKAVTNTIYAVDTVFIDEIKNDKEIALKVLSYRNARINLTWFGDALKKEISTALGYDITEKPIDLDVMADVEKYLKTKIEEAKREQPKVAPKEVVKEEPKQEVKPVITKEVTPKQELKPLNDDKITQNINDEIIDLNGLLTKLRDSQTELNSLKKEREAFLKIITEQVKLFEQNMDSRVNEIEKRINDISSEINKETNILKTKILDLRKS